MYILDPIELLEASMERQIDLIDKDDNYPCCLCGKKENVFEMMPYTAAPNSPLICNKCFEKKSK